ncbi:MAG: hypothetical protein V4494_01805 [Chlamydiota bacterium]
MSGLVEVRDFSTCCIHELQEISASSKDCGKRVDDYLKKFWEEIKMDPPSGEMPLGSFIEKIEKEFQGNSFLRLSLKLFENAKASLTRLNEAYLANIRVSAPRVVFPHDRSTCHSMSREGFIELQRAAAAQRINEYSQDSCIFS